MEIRCMIELDCKYPGYFPGLFPGLLSRSGDLLVVQEAVDPSIKLSEGGPNVGILFVPDANKDGVENHHDP